MSEPVLPFEQIFLVGGTSQTGHRLIEEILSRKFAGKLVATSRLTEGENPAGDLAVTLHEALPRWNSKLIWRPLDLNGAEAEVNAQLDSIKQCFDTNKPISIILSAAFTNVDGCEVDPEKCKRFNESNTEGVIEFFKKNFSKNKIVFFSSDYVFDGKSGPYGEDVPYSPLGNYARSKVYVEKTILKNCEDFLIIRTTGVFDYLKGSKNFLMQMISLWSAGKKTKIPKDQFSNPVWAKDLAFATVELISKNQTGIFNVAGGEQLSRDEFAKKIAETFKLDATCIEPVTTQELNQKSARPLKGGLVLDKLYRTIKWKPLPATEVLRRLKHVS